MRLFCLTIRCRYRTLARSANPALSLLEVTNCDLDFYSPPALLEALRTQREFPFFCFSLTPVEWFLIPQGGDTENPKTLGPVDDYLLAFLLLGRLPYDAFFSFIYPILRIGFSSPSNSCFMASNTIWKFSSYFFSIASILRLRSL
jgi:hypothetical protein